MVLGIGGCFGFFFGGGFRLCPLWWQTKKRPSRTTVSNLAMCFIPPIMILKTCLLQLWSAMAISPDTTQIITMHWCSVTEVWSTGVRSLPNIAQWQLERSEPYSACFITKDHRSTGQEIWVALNLMLKSNPSICDRPTQPISSPRTTAIQGQRYGLHWIWHFNLIHPPATHLTSLPDPQPATPEDWPCPWAS